MESSGDPNQVTGRYKGLLQLDDKEFRANGGTGSIFDPEQNIMAGVNKLSREKLQFEQKYGRPATMQDLYLVHNQGAAGYGAHLRNPDAPAWQNMAGTLEGKQKGPNWAKAAIWGNLPKSVQAKYGSVENVTGQNFIDERNRITAGTPSQAMGEQRARHAGIPSEVEARATEPTRKPRVEEEYTPPFKPISSGLPGEVIPWSQ